MARPQRAVALLAGLALIGGCTGPVLDKAGGRQARQPTVLTLANFDGNSGELDGFANNVARLSGGTMRIDIEYHWRQGQAGFETGLIGTSGRGRPIWASSAAGPGTPPGSAASGRLTRRF